MAILFDQLLGQRVNSGGGISRDQIRLGYQAAPTWVLQFVSADPDLATVTAVDVSDAVTWQAAVDDDFDSATEPMVRVLNADIDSSDAANGNISVSLDAETATFATAIGTNASIRAYFQLRGLNASAKVIYEALFEILATNAVDPLGGTPPEPVGDYYDSTQVDALLSGKQDLDATLTSIAALGTAANKMLYTTDVDTWAEADITAAGRALLDDADAAAQRQTLDLEPGVDVQAYDATLQSLSALGTAADKLAYTTGIDTWAETAITAAGRALLDDATAAAQRVTLLPSYTGKGGYVLSVNAGETDTEFTIPSGTQIAIDTRIHGFVDRAETSIAFDDGTYTLTLTDAGGGWSYYRDGIKYTISGNKTAMLAGSPPATDKYFFWIDATDGTISYGATPWSLTDSKVPVAIVCWNDTLTPKYCLQDERHNSTFNKNEHSYQHNTFGTRYQSGGELSTYSVAPAVPADADNQYSIAETLIWDEDYQHTLPLLTAGDNYHIEYRTGASTWAWLQQAYPFKYTAAGYIQWDNAGTMTEADNGKFINTWLVATTGEGTSRYTIVHGQTEHATLTAAQAVDLSAIDLTGLQFVETIAIWKIIWETKSTYTTVGKCRIASAPVKVNKSVTSSSSIPGLGTMATQNANAVAITGGTITGITDLAIADGGTGASTAADARANLDLEPGVDIQAYDATLTSIAGLGTAADKMLYTTGVDTWAESAITTAGRAILDDADAATQRVTLGVISENISGKETSVDITSSSSVLTLNTSYNINCHILTENTVLAVPDVSGWANGTVWRGDLFVKIDAGGSYAMSFNASWGFEGGVTPTLSAGADEVDHIVLTVVKSAAAGTVYSAGVASLAVA